MELGAMGGFFGGGGGSLNKNLHWKFENFIQFNSIRFDLKLMI